MMIDQSDNNSTDKKSTKVTNLRLISAKKRVPTRTLTLSEEEFERKRELLADMTSSSWDASSSDVLRVVLNHVSEAILTMDLEGRIEMANPAAASLLGEPAKEMLGRPWWNFLSRANREEFRAMFRDWRNEPSELPYHGPQEALLVRQDGSFVEVDLSLSGIPGADPKIIVVLHDLTVHKAENRELRRLARSDALTGLANRRAFDEVLHRTWKDCNHTEMPLSVIMLDVDYFKRFNDEHGHLQGDYCLTKIATAINSQLPSNRCLAARYGGEEFAVILPGCNERVAQSVADDIRRAVERLDFVDQGLPMNAKVSVSQGIASHQSRQFRTCTALLSAADTALYHAKSTGRNKVVMCPSRPDV